MDATATEERQQGEGQEFAPGPAGDAFPPDPAAGGEQPAPVAGDDGEKTEPEQPTEPRGDGDPDAEPAKRRSELSGKYMVLAGPVGGPYTPLTTTSGEETRLQLFEGDRRNAELSALDANPKLAEKIKEEPGKWDISAVPASSWQPWTPKPRPRRTDWV